MNESKREIPGLRIQEGREVRYISDDGNNKFEEYLFKKVTTHLDKPIAQNGGVISENCKIWLPSGELLHAISYKGDIEGWRKEMELSTEQLGLWIGKIVDSNIKLSDGRSFLVEECKIEFY
ncbi:MAG: hypothetical protein M3R17_17555 [Bacteroidota bacterium]|nr:hypothetical protein [Bacteroidota bacterium]